MSMREEEKKERSERSDKKTRVNSPLTKSTHEKLVKLSMATGISKTALGSMLIEHALNDLDFITEIQSKHQGLVRIVPSKVNGETKFVFVEKIGVK